MTIKQVYNITKDFIARQINKAKIFVTGTALVFSSVAFNSCENNDDSSYTVKQEYIYLNSFENMDEFMDAARTQIVNKRNNGRVLYKLTPTAKDEALNKITVRQWGWEIRKKLQDLQVLASKQVHPIVFRNEKDTLYVNKSNFDAVTESDSIGIGGGKDHLDADLLFLKHCGFVIIPLNENQH